MKEEGLFQWGFVRETRKKAQESGIDPDTGICRTGMEDYLKVIFPEIAEDAWIHDKKVPNNEGKDWRPDYRCDELKLIIEFDGTPHYQDPQKILGDVEHTAFFESLGYRVVRIPYFIQLTNEVVKQMFGRDIDTTLFDPQVASMGIKNKNTPAYCCYEGLLRMAKEFHLYPQQYEVNLNALSSFHNEHLTGAFLLENFFNKYERIKTQSNMSVVEFFDNPFARFYHITLANNKENILKEGLLCEKEESHDSPGLKGIYVCRTNNEKVLSSIAQAQKGFDDTSELILITLNPQKHKISAKDIVPDDHDDPECNVCSKILKDVKNITEEDITTFTIGKADIFGLILEDLSGYNRKYKEIYESKCANKANSTIWSDDEL